MRARLAAVAGLAALVLVAAGCGSTKSPSVASLGAAAATTTTDSGGGGSTKHGNVQAFVRCLQQHGVSAQVTDGGHGVSIQAGKGSGLFDKAQKACQKYLPGGGPKTVTPAQRTQVIAQMRAFSKCMRAHGLAKFPDPSPDGGIRLDAGSGLDPRSPQFQAAQKACGGPGGGKKGVGGFALRVSVHP